jgi:hypothetical protein
MDWQQAEDPAMQPESVEENGLRLAVAIDPRMAEVWACLFSSGLEPEEVAGQIGWFLRMAYLHGYQDGLCEPEAGSLYRELGMRVPRRRSYATRSKRAKGKEAS